MPIKNKVTIVYAEDSKAISQVVKSKLQSEEYNVIHFENGIGVIDAVRKFKPTIILLDYEMPHKDGFTVLKEIREFPDLSSIPIIFLTTKHDQESVVKCVQLGVTDYIVKDALAINEIVSRIKKYLRK